MFTYWKRNVITTELMKLFYDLNLSYLLLAQRLINDERDIAMFRLGINDQTADAISLLSLPQMIELAETNLLVLHFRFNDCNTIDCLIKESRIDDLQQVHASILLSSNLLQELSCESYITKKRDY